MIEFFTVFSYLLIPFLLELRTIMDWMFTDTALGYIKLVTIRRYLF